MAIVVLLLLFVAVAAAVAYPLISRQAPAVASAPAVADSEIARAVRRLRDARRHGLHCSTCGHAYQEGDRFCVQCGADLPLESSPTTAQVAAGACPECGTPLRPGDIFCSKCGYRVAAGEES